MPRIGAPQAGRKDEHEEAIEALRIANRHLHHRLTAAGRTTTTIDTLAWATMLNDALGAYNAARCENARLRRINAELEDQLDPVRLVG